MSCPRRLLVLYWHPSSPDTLRNAIRKHLAALENSPTVHEILYYNVFTELPPEWLRKARFDAVIFHTLALTQRWQDLFNFRKVQYRWIAELDCAKIAIPQDEYDHNEVLDEFLYEMGVDVIFTNFDASHRAVLYPIMHERAEFVECLTGYVDEDLVPRYQGRVLPIHARPIDIVYRAAHLPYWFGRQGQLKHRIASIVGKAALARGLSCNISTRHQDTIVGHQWLDFMASSRAVIGCESGATCLDRRGDLKARITRLQAQKPGLTFEEASRLLPPGWDDYRFLAISPRHLEAVMTRTCQLLVEGHYNGVLLPNTHYIPIKEDFSDLDRALDTLCDHARVQEMVDRAYTDVIVSGRYTHQSLATDLEAAIERHCKPKGIVARVAGDFAWPRVLRRALARGTGATRLKDPVKSSEIFGDLHLYQPLPDAEEAFAEPTNDLEAQLPIPQAGLEATARSRALRSPAGVLGLFPWLSARPQDGPEALQPEPGLEALSDGLLLLAGPDARRQPPAWAPVLNAPHGHLPVCVALPVLEQDEIQVHAMAGCSVALLSRHAGSARVMRLNQWLHEQGVRKPICMADDLRVGDLMTRCYTASTVFMFAGHGLAGPWLPESGDPQLIQVLERADLVVSPTEPVTARLKTLSPRPLPMLTRSWSPDLREILARQPETRLCRPPQAVFVSGQMQSREEADQLVTLAGAMPDWQFVVEASPALGDNLQYLPNVRLLEGSEGPGRDFLASRCRVALLCTGKRCQAEVADEAWRLVAAGVPVVAQANPFLPLREGSVCGAADSDHLVEAIRHLGSSSEGPARCTERDRWLSEADPARLCRAVASALTAGETTPPSASAPRLDILWLASSESSTRAEVAVRSGHRVHRANPQAARGELDLTYYDAVVLECGASVPPLPEALCLALRGSGAFRLLLLEEAMPGAERIREFVPHVVAIESSMQTSREQSLDASLARCEVVVVNTKSPSNPEEGLVRLLERKVRHSKGLAPQLAVTGFHDPATRQIHTLAHGTWITPLEAAWGEPGSRPSSPFQRGSDHRHPVSVPPGFPSS